MSVRGTTVCWKLLDSISESNSPAEFLAFYEAIKDAARATNQSCSLTDKLPDEGLVRGQMVEAIGRSLQPNPPTLPSITYVITINGESWHVILSATAIPHLRAAVVEWEPKSESETASRFQITRWLLQNRIAGFGKIENDQFQGKTWEVYLFCKIGLLTDLRKSLNRDPFQRKAVLLAPDRVFSQLETSMPVVSTFQNNPEGIRKFLDECDNVLTKQIGQTELVHYLEGSPVSPKQFLRAQKPSIFGMRF
jgi:hypothetical protein